jgi:hypothetical protein
VFTARYGLIPYIHVTQIRFVFKWLIYGIYSLIREGNEIRNPVLESDKKATGFRPHPRVKVSTHNSESMRFRHSGK